MRRCLTALTFAVVPAVCALLARLLRLAQGEKVEEITIGIMIGIGIDSICLLALCTARRVRR